MMSTARIVPLLLASLFAHDSHAWGDDYYVDSVHGDDSNSGTTAQDAWKTISHGLDRASTLPVTRLIIAAGTYNDATGEQFPLYSNSVDLWGAEGRARTLIEGEDGMDVLYVTDSTNVQGLSLSGGRIGIRLFPNEFAGFWNLEDLQIEGMSSFGLYGRINSEAGAEMIYDLTEVHVRNCDDVGIYLEADSFMSGETYATLYARACSVEACASGIEILSDGGLSDSEAYLWQCRIQDNAGHGALVAGYDEIRVVLEDSLIAGNAQSGFVASNNIGLAVYSVARCTFAHNTQVGLLLTGGGLSSEVRDSILWGNGDDLLAPASVELHGNDIEDGDGLGSNGNVSEPPLFIDPAQGDFRLAQSSPCIDALPPSLVLDASGVARGVDGNLDGLSLNDRGALEHRPLWTPNTASLGAEVALELFGPSAGQARVFGVVGPAQSQPLSTPFGELWLDRSRLFVVGNVATDPVQAGQLQYSVGTDIQLIGQDLSFQAWTTSNVVTPGRLLTNYMQVRIDS